MTRVEPSQSLNLPSAKKSLLEPIQLWLIIGFIAVGAVFRLASSSTDLWYEEVLSWKIATQAVHSPLQILTKPEAQIGNNHPLNTLFIWILGAQSFWPMYRLLSFLTGTAAIGLAAKIMLRYGKWAAVAAAALVAMSYPLVVYSSEARGYAPMICFALLAFDALEGYLQRHDRRSLVIYNIAVILGFLSHPTFFQFYLAVLLWSVYIVVSGKSNERSILDVIKLNAGPLIVLVGLYLIFFRHLAIDTSGSQPLAVTLVSSLSMLIGGPENTPATAMVAKYVCIVGAIAVLASMDWIGPRRGEMLAFFIAAIVVAPVLYYVIQFDLLKKPDAVAPKYFLVPLTFAMMLIGLRLGGLMNRPGSPRVISIVLLSVMFIGNAWQIWEFANHGRGDYSAAVQWMSTNSEGKTITVITNEDPRLIQCTQDLLDFYKQILPEGKTIQFVDPRVDPMKSPPQWFIANTTVSGQAIQNEIRPNENVRYTFNHSFDYYGLSGWTWQLFKLDTSQPNQ